MYHNFKIAADIDSEARKSISIHKAWWDIISKNLGPWLRLLDAIDMPDFECFLDTTVLRGNALIQAKDATRHGVIIMAKMIHKHHIELLLNKDVFSFLVVGFYIGFNSKPNDDQTKIVRMVQSLFLEVYSINNHPSNPEDAYNATAASLGIDMTWPESVVIQDILLH